MFELPIAFSSIGNHRAIFQIAHEIPFCLRANSSGYLQKPDIKMHLEVILSVLFE